MPEESILEPLDLYNNTYKEKVHDAAGVYFDECIEKSGVNLDEHRARVKKYDQLKEKYNTNNRKGNRLRGWKTFLVLMAVLGGVLAVASVFATVTDSWVTFSVLLVVGIILLVGSILIICLVINKRLKDTDKIKTQHEKELDKLYEQCVDEVTRVMAQFDWNIPTRIIRENVPLIQLDDEFDMKKYDYLTHKYHIGDNGDKDTSAVFLLSGMIAGNPFLFMRNFYTYMGQHTYTGTRIVTYPVRIRTQHGWTTTMRTQTLVANLVKPAPEYAYETFLVYGNDSAPHLNFSRTPTIHNLDTDKEIQKYVKDESKKLKNLGDKAIKDAKKFTPMTNNEFDSIFHAWNRNNEVEFRLLYTPLAQENTLKLLKNTTPNNPYGDDFKFTKKKCLNYITSDHAQLLDVYMRPNRFRGYYDLDLLRKDFVYYIDDYFKSLYFDLAPLLSIPLYQQMEPREFIYQDTYDSNYTMLEDECAVNAFPKGKFAPEGSRTDLILKTKIQHKYLNYDQVKVTAYSYRGEDRVTPVKVIAGNGHPFTVPVPWVEYFPISKDTTINIASNNVPKKDYQSCFDRFNDTQSGKLIENDNFLFHHGFIVMLHQALKNDDPKALDNFIDTIFGYNSDPNSSDSNSDSVSQANTKSVGDQNSKKK